MAYQHIGKHVLEIFWSDLGPLVQCQTRIAKLISAYNSFIIGPRGLGRYINIYKIMGWQSFGVVGFNHGPLLQGETSTAKPKRASTLQLKTQSADREPVDRHWLLFSF